MQTLSILEYFEYVCHMSSKSINVISSYTVSKLVRFLRHSVYTSKRKSSDFIISKLYQILTRAQQQTSL